MGDLAMLPDKRKSISSRPCAGEKKAPPVPASSGCAREKAIYRSPPGMR